MAPRLLNAVLSANGRAARIVEVEAYDGANDPASHAFRGMTPRNGSMFGAAGLLYVYRSYGMHWCCNVVVGAAGNPAAVLLRAGEIIEGLDAARADRPRARRDVDLANGPGKLCASLGINGDYDGVDLFDSSSPVRLELAPRLARDVASTTRVGITRAVDRPWRFFLDGDPCVSKGRPSV